MSEMFHIHPDEHIMQVFERPGAMANNGMHKEDDVWVRTGRRASPWTRHGLHLLMNHMNAFKTTNEEEVTPSW